MLNYQRVVPPTLKPPWPLLRSRREPSSCPWRAVKGAFQVSRLQDAPRIRSPDGTAAFSDGWDVNYGFFKHPEMVGLDVH